MSSPLKTYICGCARNCEIFLPYVFANIEKIGALFDEYKILIAYDRSDDKTLRVLCNLKKRFPSMEIMVNPNPVTPFRTQNIANARNQMLRYIRRENRNDYNYFIMIDLDDVCCGDIDTSVLDRYLKPERVLDWDSLSFNRKIYYDLWALSVEPYVYSCWHFSNGRKVVNDMRDYIKTKLDNIPKGELLECLSAFNGFAIYRKDMFDNVEYEWNIHKNIEIIPRDLVVKNINIVNDRIIQNNTEEDCEHRYFHIRATQLNGARIRISPECLFLK